MKYLCKIIFILLLIMTIGPSKVLSHQPRVVDSERIIVKEPEISKAYYGILLGNPHFYLINSKSSFHLYVNVLVPFVVGKGKKIIIEIFKDDQYFGKLSPGEKDWKKFFEPFGHSTYWQGPEFKVRAEGGNYKILVKSQEDPIRYVLAIGEKEAFGGREGLDAILLIPELKRDFFEEPSLSFILSPLGWGYVLFLQLVALLVGWILFKAFKVGGKEFIGRSLQKFGWKIVILYTILWLGLLFWAISTSWHPILILLSGFSLFTALISWHELRCLTRIEH